MSGNCYDRRQLRSMCFAASFAPVTRLLPKVTAQLAGKNGWLAPLAALPLLLLFLWYFSSFMKMRRSGEGLGELIMRTNRRGFGSFTLCLIALFFIFSCGFILRTGAHRLISTIYPAAGPWVFMLSMLLLGTAAALGPIKALPRASRVFAPVLVSVMLLGLVFSASSVSAANLLPVELDRLDDVFLGSLAVVEIYGGVIYSSAVLEDRAPLQGRRFASFAGWIALVCLLLTAVCAVITGCYGAELTGRFSHPFFSMIRDVTLFKTVERIEALVAALWVLSDFVIFTLLLTAASHMLRLVFGYRPERCDVPMADMKNGRYLIAVSAVMTGIVAALLPTAEHGMKLVSQVIVPCISLGIIFLLLPVCYARASRSVNG